jgi:hypothetical protein
LLEKDTCQTKISPSEAKIPKKKGSKTKIIYQKNTKNRKPSKTPFILKSSRSFIRFERGFLIAVEFFKKA